MPPEPFPGVEGVTVERDVPCRLRDGTTLVADVYRPAEGARHPVLLMRTPYDKTGGQTSSGYAHPSWFARHGYMVVVQDTRGRGRSGGSFAPFVHEAADGYDAVEWAARLPGADGRVAMYGFSYVGATQLLAAAARPPSLVAIAPAFTSSSFYEGWTYEGGALSLAFAACWAAGLAYETARRDGDESAMDALARAVADPLWLSRLPLDELEPLTRERAPYFFEWLEHPSEDDYWRAISVREDYSRLQVPALHIAGWYDVFLNGSVENFVELERRVGRQKLVVGPWTHGPWVPTPGAGAGGDAAAPAINDWQLRWLDLVLKGVDTGVLDSPVTAFVLGDGWRDLDAWPPSGARPLELFLRSRGRANSRHGDGELSEQPPADEPPDVFVYDPLSPSASAGGHSCCYEPIVPVGPASQRAREDWGDVLVYTSEPLERELELLGDAEVTVYAASTALDTDLTARLCVVDPHGESINLAEGIRRGRYRRSLAEPQLLTPGAVEEYPIRLGPVGAAIPAGYRLRVDVSSSDFPHWDRNLNTGGPLGREGPAQAVVATQSVLHTREHPSRLTIWVRD
jgi:putative CocE/NonD family hydrolase